MDYYWKSHQQQHFIRLLCYGKCHKMMKFESFVKTNYRWLLLSFVILACLFLLLPSDTLENQIESEEEIENDPTLLSKMPSQQENSVETFDSVQKVKRFPECNSTRRLEHPGVWANSPRVQYIHMPKAGGTSIQQALHEWTKANPGVRYFKYDSNTVGFSSTKCPGGAFSATLLAGHRGFGYCQNIEKSSRGLFTFTAIREPVSRMISWFYYNLEVIHDDRVRAAFGHQTLSLDELIKKYDSTDQVEYGEKLLRYAGSQQARFLCGYTVCKI